MNGASEPSFWGLQHFLLKGLPWLRGLDTEQLTWLPGSEVFSQRGPPPPRYTCCHHLSMARRHSLSQQMRGLSERAPQFLRDCGEEGGFRHARLWFLPTVLLLVQARVDHSLLASSNCLGLMKENDQPHQRVVVFPCCELICADSLSVIMLNLDRKMA